MTTYTLAANNGDVGGGEVMLLAVADALTALDRSVQIVAPDGGANGVAELARGRGHQVVTLPGPRRQYLQALRAWRRSHRSGVLWCHGLVPAFATAGDPQRIVHLHQIPTGAANRSAAVVARRGALVTLVPSWTMAREVPGSRVLWNWVDAPVPEVIDQPRDGVVRVGFLGRHSTDKGLGILAKALANLDHTSPGRYHLVLAGEARFVDATERQRVEAALAPVEHLVDRLGWVDTSQFFGRVDVAVFPSVAYESFGLVVAEAMASRTSFVISDAGALAEVAGPAYPWVARRGDADSLTEVLNANLREGEGARVQALSGAQDRWSREFSPAAGTRRVAQLLEDLERISHPDRP